MVLVSGDRWDAIKLHESVDMVPNNIYLDLLWYTHGVTFDLPVILNMSSFHLHQFIDSAYL